MPSISNKIMTLGQAVAWSKAIQANGKKLVVTNGVFDLLHRGHAQYLHDAAELGDALLVAINSDNAVHKLKGPSRPVVGENDRAFMLAALESVSAVVIFDATKPLEVFRSLHVDVYAKGGDYTEDTLDREEYALLKAQSPKFAFIPFVTGFSTTRTIKQIRHEDTDVSQPSAASFDPRLNLIFTRRSIRAYQPRPIGDDIIRNLLAAGMAAPSACAADPWHFVVITDPSARRSLAMCLPNGKFLADAPLVIVACGELAKAHDAQESYLLQDVSAAIENILLAANALSLGSCWIGIHPRQGRIDAVSSCLALPKGVVPVGAIAIGYPAQEPPPRTRLREERIHQSRFQS